MIKVSVNNQAKDVKIGCNVKQAIEILGYKSDAMLGVAINQVFISKDNWEKTVLKENDKIDILNPVSGG